MIYRRVQQWFNLVSVLKYGLGFFFALAYLPFTAFPGLPGSSLFSGLWVDLGPIQVFWTAVALFFGAWSLAFTVGLLIDTAELRWDPEAEPLHQRRQRLAAAAPGEAPGREREVAAPSLRRAPAPGLEVHLPDWAVRFFGVPITRGHLRLASAQALVGLLIVVAHARSWWQAVLAVAAAALFAYVVMILVSIPARLVARETFAEPRFFLGCWLYRAFDRRWLRKLSTLARDVLSAVFLRLGLRYILKPVTEDGRTCLRIVAAHYFAVCVFVNLVLLALLAAWLFFPPDPILPLPSPAALLYILITLFLWTVMGLDSHLSRLRVSPLLVIGGVMFLVWTLWEADHDYRVQLRPLAAAEVLSPVEVARGSRASDNLVVVASAGGGIRAAGWTSLALKELIAERPRLVHEIRLLSTISGSSVAAGYYAARFRNLPDAAALPPPELERELEALFRQSTTSSLAENGYGYALLDFWRLFLPQPPLFPQWDRGRVQEDAWRRIAGGDELRMSALREPIRSGRIPALVMSSTVLEKGQPVMLTPLSFTDRPDQVRAMTLSEFLGAAAGTEADLDVWTAARMSATFAFISPAARAEIHGADGKVLRAEGAGALHLIDGGYYDDYGVTSALDWLQPVLEARLAAGSGLGFKRVAIVQLRSASAVVPPKVDPVDSSLAAVLGPVIAHFKLRIGGAVARNGIDLSRFEESWNGRFARQQPGVCVARFEFRPPPVEREECRGLGHRPPSCDPPLSWHLTRRQIEDQRDSWVEGFDPARAGEPGSLRYEWERLKAFLERPSCPGEEEPLADPEEMLAEQQGAG